MTKFYLEGNFAPVRDEATAYDLPVEGAVPDALSGRYLRNGPNPVTPVDPGLGLRPLDQFGQHRDESLLAGLDPVAPIGFAERDLPQAAVGRRDLTHALDVP